MRWQLLDEVVEIRKGHSALTKSRVPQSEYSAEFLMIEMMAQTAGLVLGAESDYRDDIIFGKIDSADFLEAFFPGQSITITASSESLRPEGSWFQGAVQNQENGFVARSRFLLISAGVLIPGKNKSTTFHDLFLNHYEVREKIR